MIPTLIADDSIAELDVILYLIKKYALPLEPAVASDGEEALHYIQQSPVELLITDIRMPFMDGLALSAKALAVNPYLKIIISSGYQDFSYAKTAISLGVEEYLLKPIQPQEFTQIILRIADKLEKEKQKRQADNLQLAYSRDQITQQLLRGALRSGKDGTLPREIRSLMPDKGELLLLTAESGSLSSLFNLKAEICQLASQFFNYPARCIPIDSQFLLLAVDFSIPADEECGNAKKRTDKFVERLKNMYHLPFRGTSSSMPAPEQLLPTVQAMKLSLSDTPPEPSENKQEIKNLDSANGKVRFVCEYISTHYQENLSLEALAEISYLHPDYLSRIFKKETGMNLNRYIKTFRLNQACRQLETTQQKITAISASVGYQNCAYFIRSFTEHFGISPEKYRQQHNQFSGGKSL